MFDVAPAFRTTRRKRMARSRQPTPLHSRSRTVWQMSLTSAFVHGRVLKKFSAFSFQFAFWLTTLVFKRGRWSQRSPVLRSSASSCWACFCLFLLGTLARCLRGLEIVWHCITQAIKEKEPEYSLSCWRIPDLWSPQFQGAFVTFTLTSRRRLSIAQWWMCQFGSAGRQVGEGGCWCRDQPRHIDVHRLVKTGCFTCSLPPFLEVLVWFSSPVRSDCYGYLLPD